LFCDSFATVEIFWRVIFIFNKKMTVGAGITVADGNLMVLGKKVLSNVHDNVLVTPPSGGSLLNGAFIGVQSDQKGSRRIFPIGKLQGLRFMSLFRFKMW
jgi:raffinose synthase